MSRIEAFWDDKQFCKGLNGKNIYRDGAKNAKDLMVISQCYRHGEDVRERMKRGDGGVIFYPVIFWIAFFILSEFGSSRKAF
jgi:hypothetical protein